MVRSGRERKTKLASGINPNAKRTNGAVVVFDHGGWVDGTGLHHGRKRSRTPRALHRQSNQGRFRAKIVLSERQLVIIGLAKAQGSVSRSDVALHGDKLLSNVSMQTLTRDLVNLAKQGLLHASGKLKQRTYSVAVV